MYFDTVTHRRWMCALAYNNANALSAHITALKLTPNYRLIRAPKNGLMQIQARMGNTGNRLFAGDITLTRVVVRLRSGTLDHSCLLGRNKQHVEQCAVVNALLQKQTYLQNLIETLIVPLGTERGALINARRAGVNTSRVDSFTPVRGNST